MDNEIAICENCRPKLSSVRPDYDEEAFHAAALLNRMLHGDHIPLVTIDSSVPEVIGRRSTGNPSGSGSLVSRALKIIDTEACQGLTAEALANRLNVSHNLLCLRFREHGGATVRNAIFERKPELVDFKLFATQKFTPFQAIRNSKIHTFSSYSWSEAA